MKPIVYVIGELNVDIIFTGKEIAPEWNREKLVDDFEMVLGSSSAITACCLAGLGADVRFVSVVGKDDFGNFCIEKLQEKGVDITNVLQRGDLKTGITLSLATEKDRALLTYMGSINQLNRDDIPQNMMEQGQHIHFGSFYLQEMMQQHWPELFKKAKDAGMTTSFDTGWDPNERWHRDAIEAVLAFTDFFIPSEDELKQIYGVNDVGELIQTIGSYDGTLALKRGALGSWLISGESKYETPAYNIRPIDTTGAGDSFNAGLIYGYLTGKRDQELLLFANANGALATQRVGGASAVPSVEDVYSFMSKNSLRAT